MHTVAEQLCKGYTYARTSLLSFCIKEDPFHPAPDYAPSPKFCGYAPDKPSALAMAMAKATVSAKCEGDKVSNNIT